MVFEGARGTADRNHGVPMRLDSKLNLGSMDKMFTAVVIGQLVDEGRLSFQDPVSKFLGGKGWTKADLSKVRVEHLLSHTSGLGSYFNDKYERMARQLLRKVDDYKALVAEETLAFEPGSKWQYSNTGFLLAGAVIEAVTGQDYFDVVRERVYAKAGMPTATATTSTSSSRTWRSATRASGRPRARAGGRTRSSTSSAAARPAAATRPRGTSSPSPRRCGRGSW